MKFMAFVAGNDKIGLLWDEMILSFVDMYQCVGGDIASFFTAAEVRDIKSK
jgi:hypothetical protein